MVDLKTLEQLAIRIERDAGNLSGMQMREIARQIHNALGGPLMWPSRIAGADYANDYYPGSPDLRLAFNHGVKWAVEHYQPSGVTP